STPGAPAFDCGKSDLSFRDASTGGLTGGCTGGITFDVTNNGGVTWRVQPLPGPGGQSWVQACGGGPCDLTAPRFVIGPIKSNPVSSGYGYMVLHAPSLNPPRSWLYVTRDGGRSWAIRALPGQETRVTMLSPLTGFASVGPVESATHWLYRTDDGGGSWQPVPSNLNLAYAALSCVSDLTCWAVSPSLN